MYLLLLQTRILQITEVEGKPVLPSSGTGHCDQGDRACLSRSNATETTATSPQSEDGREVQDKVWRHDEASPHHPGRATAGITRSRELGRVFQATK